MRLPFRTRLLLAALLAVAAPSAAADVLVVDIAGGGDFTQMQAAIDAAADGDILLIRPGAYTAALFNDINGKGLVLVGDVGTPPILPPLQIRNLPAGSSLVLRRLDLRGSGIVGLIGATVVAVDNAGVVVFEECTLSGLPGGPGFQGQTATPGRSAASVASCAGVSFHRCTLAGGHGTNTNGQPFPIGQFVTSDGGTGTFLANSSVAFYDCVIRGGDGGNDLFGLATKGGNGGLAVSALGSRVFTSGCVIEAGDGGDGCSPAQVADGCRGGNGFTQSNGGSAFQELDTMIAAGVGGAVDGGGTGSDGTVLQLNGLPHFAFGGSAVSLAVDAPSRSGERTGLSVAGPELRLFALFFALQPGHLPLFHFKGVFVPGFPLEGPVLLEVMPPGGVLDVQFVAPSLAGLGIDGFITVDQVFMDQGADGVILSGATTHIQVDSGF